MLTGPIDATHRLLERTGMTMNDIDLTEINEAFASVVLAWERELSPGPLNFWDRCGRHRINDTRIAPPPAICIR